MNEFEEKDYEQAYSLATTIQSDANDMLEIFNNVDRSMTELFGENWKSSGADVSNGRYEELRKNYQVFYDKVIAMVNHIAKVTNRNIDTDKDVAQTFNN